VRYHVTLTVSESALNDPRCLSVSGSLSLEIDAEDADQAQRAADAIVERFAEAEVQRVVISERSAA